jgi:hypothetical protein
MYYMRVGLSIQKGTEDMKKRWALFTKLRNGEEHVTPHECTWLEMEKHVNRLRIINGPRGIKYKYIELRDVEA